MMTRKVDYRKALLRAIDAFLEESPEAHQRGHQIVKRCYNALKNKARNWTIDKIVWSSSFVCLKDSVFYGDNHYLQKTRSTLLEQVPDGFRDTAIFNTNFREYFSLDEKYLYDQLWDMLDLLMNIPFAQIYTAATQAREKNETWKSMLVSLPEVALAETMETEYQHKKISIEDAASKSPPAQYLGDETIYHFVLMEVTHLLTGILVSTAAVFFGYPVLATSYTLYESSKTEAVDVTQRLVWAKTLLEALRGEKQLFLSWRLGKGATAHSDVLLLSLS